MFFPNNGLSVPATSVTFFHKYYKIENKEYFELSVEV